MTLTQLKYIVALTDKRHFGQAAAHCCVSQSALSMAVKALEAELNLVLFERDRSGVRITPDGQRVVAKARQALQHSNNIDLLAASAQTRLSQPLNIGVCDAYAPYYLPRLTQQLSYRAPQTPLTLAEGVSSGLIKQLLDGELDVVIASYQYIEGATTRLLTEEPLVVVMRQHDPLALAVHLPLAALAEEHLWLPSGSLKRDITDDYPQLLAAVKTVEQLNVGLHTLLQHISVAGGITIAPLSLINNARLAADGLAARALDGEFTRKIALLTRASFPCVDDIDSLATEVIDLCGRACWSQTHGASEALLIDNNYW
ncbi:LysR family transcriptional regulator [Gilvimarinus polysaccharolyticus]|uniref:LysR family transcriptional regulator n=1 Tax=Gilvimarinus polysaccharolyticus TaxID=863921 RepID=UPI0006738BEF|nr:LysR family transcriptional regulator [Gilvimarinus polysaccharolyticus]